jgi:hypothetical protein
VYVRYVLVWYAAVCHYCRLYVRASDNDIRPHTIQEHNERTSTEFNLVTAQSTAHEPPEDGRKYRPKHVGANFKVFLKCVKVCMGWNKRNNHNNTHGAIKKKCGI